MHESWSNLIKKWTLDGNLPFIKNWLSHFIDAHKLKTLIWAIFKYSGGFLDFFLILKKISAVWGETLFQTWLNFPPSYEKSLVIAIVAGSQGQTQFAIIPYINSAVNKYLPMTTHVCEVHSLSIWAYIWLLAHRSAGASLFYKTSANNMGRDFLPLPDKKHFESG